MKTPELKPCPFCGRAGILLEMDRPCLRNVMYQVQCSNRECKIQPMTDFHVDESVAVTEWNRRVTGAGHCVDVVMFDDLTYIQQLESSRWELFEDLSTAYYGKQMYGLNDDGTVYSRYSCDTMSFEQAVDEFRRLIADE